MQTPVCPEINMLNTNKFKAHLQNRLNLHAKISLLRIHTIKDVAPSFLLRVDLGQASTKTRCR
eukprot:10497353-Heterocapsa_arctica.AAC.1